MIKPFDIDRFNSKMISGRKQTQKETVFGYVLLGVILPILTALLAWQLGMPIPTVHDEFSYLFMADTFAMGRLTNPAHPLAEFFQTFHIIHYDGIYASKYFPGIGVQLLVGKIIGHPMIGVWLTIGLFGASLLFVLRQFFQSRVALFVSSVFTMEFMVLSYFGHSYWGGSLVALSGVWILGGAFVAAKTGQVRYAWLSALGVLICLLTRPFEGFFYSVPLICWALWNVFRGNCGSEWRWDCRGLAAPLAIGTVFGVLVLGAYNQRITGSWRIFPHSLYEKIYTPHGVRFLWESKTATKEDVFFESLPKPFHQLRDHYFVKQRERAGKFVEKKIVAASEFIPFQFPLSIIWLLVASLAFRSHWRNGLWRLCVFTGILRLAPFLLSWSSKHPHYGAFWIFPLAMLGAFGLNALFEGKRSRRLARVAVAIFLCGLFSLYCFSFFGDPSWKRDWTSYSRNGNELKSKAAVRDFLMKDDQSNAHLVFVEYENNHSFHSEWVYNTPDIDAQAVVWAHDLGEETNSRLRDYYAERTVWKVEVGNSKKIVLKTWNGSEKRFDPAKEF